MAHDVEYDNIGHFYLNIKQISLQNRLVQESDSMWGLYKCCLIIGAKRLFY